MKHKVRLTVIDKKLYPELQQQYCADPNSGVCPCYNVGDVFEFYRDGDRDDFWHCGLNTLIHTAVDPDTVAGGPKMPHCSELWDASKEARRLPHSHQGRRGALFYASISIVMPDLNSTVKWSAKTVIFSMSFLTRASSNSVMSVS